MAVKGSVAPLEWLRQQDIFPRWYWAGRDTDEVVAACGVAYAIAAEPGDAASTRVLDALRRLVPTLPPQARLFGGLRFNAARPSDALWRPFDQCAFVVPTLQLRCRGGEAVLTRCHPRQQQSDILCHFERFSCHPAASEGSLHLSKRGEILPRCARQDDSVGESIPKPTNVSASEHWQQNVARALRRIEQGELAKVVLAHKQTWRVEESPLDPLAVFAAAAARSPGGCFRFFWQPCPDTALAGWSPERLYARAGADVRTEAVAGTRPRCHDKARDAAWADALMRSDKDRREHEAVVRFVRRALRDACDRVDVGLPRVVSAALVQHLKTPMRGRLRAGVTDADILARLHPTPAVCGAPS
ncbi:MAG: chorismate-binding protein, partial [Myxococcota bacterium]